MRSPSTAISRPGGCVEIAVAVGGFPYSLAAPSMSPADNRSDPTGIPGGDRSHAAVVHGGGVVVRSAYWGIRDILIPQFPITG